MVHGIHVHLRPSVNWAFYGPIWLQISIKQQRSRDEFRNFCETIYGLHGKFHLWPFVNQVLQWIHRVENKNCCKNLVNYKIKIKKI